LTLDVMRARQLLDVHTQVHLIKARFAACITDGPRPHDLGVARRVSPTLRCLTIKLIP